MGMASAKPKLTEKRSKGGGLASAKPNLTEKRSRVEDWLRRNGGLVIMESEEWSKFFILHWLSPN